ncbi:MAG: helix-turn-helix transcriptional regulator [Thermoanaerobaculia bacterium]
MKLGDVLRKEREGKGLSHVELSVAEVADKLGISEEEYLGLEGGESPAEVWGPRLAQIAIKLETPTSRLLAESGRFADTEAGSAGDLIREHRQRRELSPAEVAEYAGVTEEEYQQIEAGESPLEKYGPLLLGFAEVIEQPVFNLFYPCGLPFQELDDYP